MRAKGKGTKKQKCFFWALKLFHVFGENEDAPNL